MSKSFWTNEVINIEIKKLQRKAWMMAGELPVSEEHQESFSERLRLINDGIDVLIKMRNRNDGIKKEQEQS